MLEMPVLREAIEALYLTFRDYPLRDDTNPCPCCHHDPESEKRIHSKPLRQLDHDDLLEYAGDALLTWGDETTFRHFLPRLFELVIHGEDGDVLFQDPQSVFAKLKFGSWRSWPVSEQTAISNYFRQLWATVIDTTPEKLGLGGAHDWLQAIAQAETDLSPYFALCLGAESEAAHRNLARIISDERLPLIETLPQDYWENCIPQWHQLVQWLLTQASTRKSALRHQEVG